MRTHQLFTARKGDSGTAAPRESAAAQELPPLALHARPPERVRVEDPDPAGAGLGRFGRGCRPVHRGGVGPSIICCSLLQHAEEHRPDGDALLPAMLVDDQDRVGLAADRQGLPRWHMSFTVVMLDGGEEFREPFLEPLRKSAPAYAHLRLSALARRGVDRRSQA